VNVLRTPDDRFADLHAWPYQPRYVDVGDGLRMHYVDEGPTSASPVLLTHGEPTWRWRRSFRGA
jgi:haloalkane dehalogenase